MKKIIAIAIIIMMLIPQDALCLRQMATKNFESVHRGRCSTKFVKRHWSLLPIALTGAISAWLLYPETQRVPERSILLEPFGGLSSKELHSLLMDIRDRDISYIESLLNANKVSDIDRINLLCELVFRGRFDVGIEYFSLFKDVAEDITKSVKLCEEAIGALCPLCSEGDSKAQEVLVRLQNKRSIEKVLPEERTHKKITLAIIGVDPDDHEAKVIKAIRQAIGDKDNSLKSNMSKEIMI